MKDDFSEWLDTALTQYNKLKPVYIPKAKYDRFVDQFDRLFKIIPDIAYLRDHELSGLLYINSKLDDGRVIKECGALFWIFLDPPEFRFEIWEYVDKPPGRSPLYDKGRPIGGITRPEGLRKLNEELLKGPLPIIVPALKNPEKIPGKKEPRKRSRDFSKLWLAYLAREKIKTSTNPPVKLIDIYHQAGQNDTSGLSHAIRNLTKIEQEEPEEFQKLMEYGKKHLVQELKEDENKEF